VHHLHPLDPWARARTVGARHSQRRAPPQSRGWGQPAATDDAPVLCCAGRCQEEPGWRQPRARCNSRLLLLIFARVAEQVEAVEAHEFTGRYTTPADVSVGLTRKQVQERTARTHASATSTADWDQEPGARCARSTHLQLRTRRLPRFPSGLHTVASARHAAPAGDFIVNAAAVCRSHGSHESLTLRLLYNEAYPQALSALLQLTH
jgi:hypothetical protein